MTEIELARVRAALAAIPARCSGETWLRAGMAAKSSGLSFDEFNAWSSLGGESYKGERDTRTRWDSFKTDGGITAGTLLHLAREHGWIEQPRRRDTRKSKHEPQMLWEAWEPATGHCYITRKRGMPDGLRIYRGELHIARECVDGWLMIPAYSITGRLQSLQFIPPGPGKKLNLPGAPMTGAFHVVGELRPDAPAYVAEGIGAAWTIHEATGAAVVVTFGSGNTARVAEAIRTRASRLVLVADRGKESAREADAGRLGCAWVEMPASLPDGADVNDLGASEGIEAVRTVLQAERTADGSNSRAYDFIRVSDLLSAGLKPVAWLVRNYVETDSIGLIFGDPACGKSFAAIDLACCIATGTPWHGNKTTPGAVFFIAGEGQNGLARRFAAWERHNGISLHGAPLFISQRPAQLCNAEAAADVSEAVRLLAAESRRSPALIIVDTLARNFGGADENSAQDMGTFIANLDEHLRSPFRACVLIVHHSGHADKGRARGSTALKGALDAEYSVGKDETGTIRFEATKMKDAEQPQPMAFRMAPVELPLKDEDGRPVTGVALSPIDYVPPTRSGKSGKGRHQATALRVLREAHARHQANVAQSGRDPSQASVALDTWRDLCFGEGIDRRRFHEVVQSLKNLRKVRVVNGHVELGEDFE